MKKIGSTNTAAAFISLSAIGVEALLREAWPCRKHYPAELRILRLNASINVIVDSHSAPYGTYASTSIFRKRRQDHLLTLKHARAFLKGSESLLREWRSDREMLIEVQANPRRIWPLTDAISAFEDARSALEKVLDRCTPPDPRDHRDPVLWIAAAAKEAWRDAPGDEKVRFGHKPEDPLVTFIELTLKSIAWEWPGSRGEDHHEAISDRLRGRKNRARARRPAEVNRGGKPIRNAPCD
jgi:hypothetical protein